MPFPAVRSKSNPGVYAQAAPESTTNSVISPLFESNTIELGAGSDGSIRRSTGPVKTTVRRPPAPLVAREWSVPAVKVIVAFWSGKASETVAV